VHFHQHWKEPACCAHNTLHLWRGPAAATAETHHPLPHCAHIRCMVSISVQRAAIKVNGRHFFFGTEEFSDTAWCHPRFHSARLPLCCCLSHGNNSYWWKGSTSTAVPPTSASDFQTLHTEGEAATVKQLLKQRWNQAGELAQLPSQVDSSLTPPQQQQQCRYQSSVMQLPNNDQLNCLSRMIQKLPGKIEPHCWSF